MPWLTFSLSLMTESVGYPAFMWAAYASVLSVARPSVEHDGLAIVAVFVAYLARTQFIFLALALPVAVLLHEIAFRLAGAAPRAGRAAGGMGCAPGSRVIRSWSAPWSSA